MAQALAAIPQDKRLLIALLFRLDSGGEEMGRWNTKTLVESCRQIDVNRWHREGGLTPGYCFNWAWWSEKGDKRASISIKALPGAVELSYTLNPGTSRAEDVLYQVEIERTPCHYGGERSWFICPGRGCGRRVAKLYLPYGGKYFLCRHCYGLAYESQRGKTVPPG